MRDLPGLYGITDSRELNSLFTTIAFNTGNEFSIVNLWKQSGIKKEKIKIYLEYLEAAYLIKKIKRIRESGKSFERDTFFKLYLTNSSLRSALFSKITSTDDVIGNMVETAIFSQWMHRQNFTPLYARWKNGEVDIVCLGRKLKPIWAVEIKWSNKFLEKPKELKSLIKFCTYNNLLNPIVTTISQDSLITYKNLQIQFLPAAAYAYTVGKRTLEINQSPWV